jgi:acetyl esterase/lipase
MGARGACLSQEVRLVNAHDMLDPEFASVVGLMPEALSAEILTAMRVPYPGPALSGAVTRTERVVPGDPEVPVRVHRANGACGALPCIYSMHGGGYIVGSYDMDDALFDRWCPKLGIVGVSVEYRLAPETPYPGPIEDCYRGLKWVYDNAEELGVDPERIGIAGVSAGGGLAAALALLARDRGEIPLAFQLLDCPMLDDRQHTWSSRLDRLEVWNREANAFGWRSYLGPLAGSADVPYHAVPARATDLHGLPPAFVSVGGVDGFLAEDVEYAMRLMESGVPTELHVYPGAPHGYGLVPDSNVARQSRRDIDNWLARQLRD